ncbi:MAG: sodium:proton antiporter [Lachnospiraceae bacterium]|nr:sodium:proton antiporter [Lachnospiraceae bacterium]
MNVIHNFPLFTVLLSLFSGVLCTRLSNKAAKYYTAVLQVLLMALSASVFFYTLQTGPFTYVLGEFPAPWGNELRAGVLESMMALFFLLVLFCSCIGGWHFLDEDIDESKHNLYFSLIHLLTAALMALAWTNDIFTGYVFLEILTLTSCGILIVREIGRTTLAAVRYMILNLLGSGLFLLGVSFLYDITGHLLLVPMGDTIGQISGDPHEMMVLTLSLTFLTIGLSIKSGLFPFHFWMPDTYGWSTPGSASILSSLVSKAYIFLLFKIFYRGIGIEVFERMPLRNILFVLGLCGIFFGSVSAIRENNLDRMVAFSSAAQIGYIYVGIGIGGSAGYTAAIFHIMAHGLTKSLLFLSAPRLAEASGNSLLFKNLTGSGLRNKSAGFFFLMASFSMIGIPGLAGFSSKLLFAYTALYSGSNLKWLLTMLMLSISSLLNTLYFIRTDIRIYNSSFDRQALGEKEPGENGQAPGALSPAGSENPAIPEAPAADSSEEMAPLPLSKADKGQKGRSAAPDYIVPATILILLNIFLGLYSQGIADLINIGLKGF